MSTRRIFPAGLVATLFLLSCAGLASGRRQEIKSPGDPRQEADGEYAPEEGWGRTPMRYGEGSYKKPQATLKDKLPAGPVNKDVTSAGKTTDDMITENVYPEGKPPSSRERQSRSAPVSSRQANTIQAPWESESDPPARPSTRADLKRHAIIFDDEMFLDKAEVDKLREGRTEEKVDKLIAALHKMKPPTWMNHGEEWGVIPTRKGEVGITIDYKKRAGNQYNTIMRWDVSRDELKELMEEKRNQQVTFQRERYWITFRFYFNEKGDCVLTTTDGGPDLPSPDLPVKRDNGRQPGTVSCGNCAGCSVC